MIQSKALRRDSGQRGCRDGSVAVLEGGGNFGQVLDMFTSLPFRAWFPGELDSEQDHFLIGCHLIKDTYLFRRAFNDESAPPKSSRWTRPVYFLCVSCKKKRPKKNKTRSWFDVPHFLLLSFPSSTAFLCFQHPSPTTTVRTQCAGALELLPLIFFFCLPDQSRKHRAFGIGGEMIPPSTSSSRATLTPRAPNG